MAFVCSVCGETHEGLPARVFHYPDLWLSLSDAEREAGKVDSDLCMTSQREFFVRAVMRLPLIDGPEPTFEFGIWGSLSEANFLRYVETYNDLDQSKLGPMFSYLSNEIGAFPDSYALPGDLIPQDVGRPLFVLKSADHPLAIAQTEGVAFSKVHEIIHPNGTSNA
jgi:hypothetical protein